MTYSLSYEMTNTNCLSNCKNIYVVEVFTSYFDALDRVSYLSKYVCVFNFKIKTKIV